jgi:hypothetical protein
VDSAGKVEKVWTGVLNDSSLAEIKQLVIANKTVRGAAENHPGL